MLLAALALAAQTFSAAPPVVEFDKAMAEKLCSTDVKADDLDGRLECLDYQYQGRRLWILFAAAGGADAQADMEACSNRWSEKGATDWRMAGSCLTEAGEPLTEVKGKQDFDGKALRALCAKPKDISMPPPPGTEGRGPVEECFFDNAVDYRIFHVLETAYGGVIGASFRRCRSDWTDGGVTNWRMAEQCAQLEIRAWERLADWS